MTIIQLRSSRIETFDAFSSAVIALSWAKRERRTNRCADWE
ncbi:hypothetical protein [Saccharopolyspora sp. NPDC050642]